MMGSLGPAELVVIAIAAIVVFGPQRLPEIARKGAKLMQTARAATKSVTSAMDNEFDGIAAPLKELKSEYDETMQTIKGMAPSALIPSVKLPDGTPPEKPNEDLAAEQPNTAAGEDTATDIEEPDDEQVTIDGQQDASARDESP